jgi:hypothetical protein
MRLHGASPASPEPAELNPNAAARAGVAFVQVMTMQ